MEGEDFFRRADHGRGETKEEMRDIDSFNDCHQDNGTDKNITEDATKLASTKAEMVEAIEENQRLKLYLTKIVEEYEALQTQYNQLMVQQEKMTPPKGQEEKEEENNESELFSLSLGRTSSPVSSSSRAKEEKQKMSLMAVERQALSLGLSYLVGKTNDERTENEKECLVKDCNNNPQSPHSSFGLEDNGGVASKNVQAPANVPQMTVSDDGYHPDDEEVFPQKQVKRARVSVRVRCDTPTMNDGCQWRKYGQKIAKGNPCPRAYYRCTAGPSCPVRKQVQRCVEDMSILITTYEGTHNHLLPMSATAMASTTSAAASTLLSGAGAAASSSSSVSSASTNLQGFNCYLSNYSSKPNSFYVQTSSCPSSSSSHPTVTLDLTSSTFSNPSLSFSSLFSRLSSSSSIGISLHQPSQSSTTSTNLNFSGSNMNFPRGGSFTTYGNTNMGSTLQLPYHHTIKNRIGSEVSNQFGTSTQPIQCNIASGSSDIFQQHIHRGIQLSSSNSGPSLTAKAIKVITADPGFKYALANVVSSIIGGERSIGGSQNVNDVSACPMATMRSHGCTSSSSSSGSKHPENIKLWPFSTSRSGYVSPSDPKKQDK